MLQKSPMYAYLPAKDVAQAREFYEKKLGFKPKREIGTSRASQAFWQVQDVEREVAELKARGVKFEEYDAPGMKTVNGIATAGGAKAAWFKDSEGNILALVQNISERQAA
jgi:catechol 2,3-dioxygenase-like lactoylglutathione lyase family enzyme